jgi:hypothetical protein
MNAIHSQAKGKEKGIIIYYSNINLNKFNIAKSDKTCH